MEDFCYLGSFLSSNSNCDKDCLTRIGKAANVFGRLKAVWKNKYISFPVKGKLYESYSISNVNTTVQCRTRLWPLTVTQKKKLEAAHHRFQRRLLGITWRDKICNEEIRRQTRLKTLELVIKQRRLRWFGHVLRMDDDRILKQAISWEMSATSRGPRRPRKNWNDIIRQDLKSTRVALEDAEHFTFDREAWHERVAQCVLIDTGLRSKAKVKYETEIALLQSLALD